MAVKMVRQPSETPNITNIDDFVGLRYAYANQNGYVKGKGNLGTGIDTDAYTVNGNTFTINSGRLVVQGVESDIEANGHSIIIDISGTKKYYAVYLEVNLSTDTSDILIKSDTVGIPNIDDGDDLTVYTNGIARMVLFTFEATNGVISNIQKVVKPCTYPIAFTTDENGVLKYGNVIIPYKKLIASNLKISNNAINIRNYIGDITGRIKIQIDFIGDNYVDTLIYKYLYSPSVIFSLDTYSNSLSDNMRSPYNIRRENNNIIVDFVELNVQTDGIYLQLYSYNATTGYNINNDFKFTANIYLIKE